MNNYLLGLILVTAACLPQAAAAAESVKWQQGLLDDCSSAGIASSIGTAWQAVSDADRGGSSTVEWSSSDSTLTVRGQIEPVPGSMGPGTAGMLLPLGQTGEVFDVNDWDGIRLTIRHSGASLLLRIHSSAIDNEDHFAVMIPESSRAKTYSFRFSDLTQVMSARKTWTGTGITGIELVSFSWVPGSFEWELEELSFFREEQRNSILNRRDE